MHGRGFRILLLALITIWYGAVLPGHQRGVVQLGGADADPCCTDREKHHSDDPASGSPRTCAVCFYMAALVQAGPPELAIEPLGPSDAQPPLSASTLIAAHPRRAYLGRAPPLA